MKHAYKIWCEWDIGDESLYTSEREAYRAIENNPVILEVAADNNSSIEEMIAEGLVGVEELNVKS